MSEPGAYSLPISFVGYDDAPIAFANAILVQNQQDEFILTLAQIAPPVALGTEEEIQRQLQSVPFVPARGLGRYGFTRRRLVELIQALETNLKAHDDVFGQEGDKR